MRSMSIRRIIFLVVAMLVIFNVMSQTGDNLLPAPHGYTWYSDSDVGVSVLRPDGWFLKTESRGETRALFISPEDIEQQGRFQTGLTVNLLKAVGTATSSTASSFAMSFANGVTGDSELLQNSTKKENGVLTITLRIKSEKLGKILHYFIVANDRDDSVVIFLYESPSAEWKAAWNVGEVMFRNLHVNIRQ